MDYLDFFSIHLDGIHATEHKSAGWGGGGGGGLTCTSSLPYDPVASFQSHYDVAMSMFITLQCYIVRMLLVSFVIF